MLSMQAFYDQVHVEDTPYLNVLKKVVSAPRMAIHKFTAAAVWAAW